VPRKEKLPVEALWDCANKEMESTG